MKKQPQKTAITKQKLLDSFWKIYSEKNIDKITIREIVTEAGYNRSTFYEYFTDIYDLLNQFEDLLINDIKENISNNFSNDKYMINQIAKLYDSKGKYISTLVLKNGNVKFNTKLKNALKPVILKEFNITEDNFKIALILEFVVSALISTITYWYNNEKPIPSEELVIMLRRILSDGAVKEITNFS